ncbi:hypothetical protein Dsin_007563 [Dipteronia sinensis]|uniref:ARID domain-containing protein n=1 Tax=Dipteronia sinensis TaxID=43782 RepID=A0AAE0B0S2_9ROSI|nr:hypothetical protein Dsin_007563 [Dipteronia sinensis]
MAGWSNLENGSALDGEKIVDNSQTEDCCLDIDYSENGVDSSQTMDCCLDIDHSENGVDSSQTMDCCLDIDQSEESGFDDSDAAYEVKLKCLFDQVLSVFLNEVTGRGCMRPVPPKLGDGPELDLFKLFWVVRERGGFGIVSENGLWSFVVKDLGLDRCVSGSVKLIYLKYLSELEEGLMGNGSKSLGNGESDCGGNFGFWSLEVVKDFRGLLDTWPYQKLKNDKLALLECKENEGCVDMDLVTSGLDFSDTKNRHAIEHVGGKRCRDDDEKLCGSDSSASLKRKRESLSGMLNWVTRIAICPHDLSIRGAKEPSGKDLRMQAIRARDALLRKRPVDSNIGQSTLQKNQKLQFSMYDDGIKDHRNQSTERTRCSGRRLTKTRLHSCCNSCSATESKPTSPCKTELENVPKEKKPVTAVSSARNKTVFAPWNRPLEKNVRVGPLFQASVPEWTGVVVESDSKWLGTRVWPLVNKEQNSLIERDFIGRGRPDSCGCQFPGSHVCVRFHITSKRMKLKRELGSAFFSWKFNDMGEEVALRWTVEEEKLFKEIAKSNPESSSFIKRKKNSDAPTWDSLSKIFRGKKRKDLIQYYFNVFLIYRRRYQNRVTPSNIDSDGEGADFGSFGESFGLDAVTVPVSELCSQNRQLTGFEQTVKSLKN